MRILRVPWLFGFQAMAPVPGVALVRTGVSGPDLEWTLRHEAVHHEQMRRDGWLRFMARYLFAGSWRARYEAEAFGRVNVTRAVDQGMDPATAARRLARAVVPRYFPRPWLGRAPRPERMAALMLEAYREAREGSRGSG